MNLTLITCISYLLAAFISHAMTQQQNNTISHNKTPMATTSSTSTFKTTALFGETTVQKKPQKTRIKAKLDIILLGTITLRNKKLSSALISQKGKSKTYYPQDKIKSGVKLLEVYPKYIVVSHAGLEKIVELKENKLSLNQPLKKSKNSLKLREKNPYPSNTSEFTPALSKRLDNYKKAIKNEPLSLINLFIGQPVSRDGQPFGIKVSPGSDPELFKAFNLKDKDIIISVEGLSVISSQNMGQLMELIQNTNFFTVELERDGTIETINISL